MQDDATTALRKQLAELGFEEPIINAVLLQESNGSVSLDQAIDLCLAHNEFEVGNSLPSPQPIACMPSTCACSDSFIAGSNVHALRGI